MKNCDVYKCYLFTSINNVKIDNLFVLILIISRMIYYLVPVI